MPPAPIRKCAYQRYMKHKVTLGSPLITQPMTALPLSLPPQMAYRVIRLSTHGQLRSVLATLAITGDGPGLVRATIVTATVFMLGAFYHKHSPLCLGTQQLKKGAQSKSNPPENGGGFFSAITSLDIKTIKEWASILERMQIIALVPPYFSNLSKRLVKSPKIFFLDNGLACRLQGWADPLPIITSPQQGPLFENLVFGELSKMIQNYQLGWQIYHWRSRDGEEIDFLLETDPHHFIFIEAKVSAQKIPQLDHFRELQKVFSQKNLVYWQCNQEGERVLDRHVPLAKLQETLLLN